MRRFAALLALGALFTCTGLVFGCDPPITDQEREERRKENADFNLPHYDRAYAVCVDTAPGPEIRKMLEQDRASTMAAFACLAASIDSLYGPQQVWE